MMEAELTGEMMNESKQTDIAPLRRCISSAIIGFKALQNFIYFVLHDQSHLLRDRKWKDSVNIAIMEILSTL